MKNRINTLQVVVTWLPQTMVWAYSLIHHLPANIQSNVLCQHFKNLDQFPTHNPVSIPKTEMGSLYERLLRRKHVYGLLGIGFAPFTKKTVAANDIAIIHSHFGNQGVDDVYIAKSLGKKHVVSFYGYDMSQLPRRFIWRFMYKKMFKKTDRVLCEGPHMAKCLEKLGAPKDKIRLLHLGVDTQKIAFQPRQWKKGETLRVFIAASFNEKKGIVYALEALALLQKKNPDITLEITLIGDSNREDNVKQNILDTIEKHNLPVRKLGFQPYTVLLEEASRHHIFLHPSVTASDGDTEGGAPICLIDMACSGMLIVSSFHADIPHVIPDKICGLLAPERDAAGLSDRLQWAVENTDQWPSILSNARKRMEEQFSAETQSARLAEIYQELA